MIMYRARNRARRREFEQRGIVFGHGVWDLMFERVRIMAKEP